MNRLILSGFIATEPDMRYTSTGKAVIHFSVSVRKGTKKSNTEGSAASAKTYDVNFFNVEAWGAVENIAMTALQRAASLRSKDD